MKRYLILAAIVAGMVVFFLLWRNHQGTAPNAPMRTSRAPEISDPSMVVSKPARGSSTRGAEPDQALQRGAGDDEKLRLLGPEATRTYNESQNPPVAFYGLVVDQNSNALQTVRVDLEVQELYRLPFLTGTTGTTTRLQSETGADGRFEVSGLKGHFVTVQALTKEGYEPELLRKNYGEYGAQSTSLEAPAVFKMWNTNMHQQLITGERRFTIIPDGRPHIIDLSKGTIAESGTGDLMVRVEYPTNAVRGQIYDWSAELRAVNGGLLEETNGYAAMCVAPAEGYVERFRQAGPMKGGGRGSTGNRRFYVTLNHGSQYGRISIELVAPFNSEIPGLVRLSYAINGSGSRVLW
jgi:hypothetical protein